MQSSIYLLGGSFTPPGIHHEIMAKRMTDFLQNNDHFFVIPCGARSDKTTTGRSLGAHRSLLCSIAFGLMPRVEIDFTDVERNEFTRTFDLYNRYQRRFPNHCIRLVIGADLIAGGARGESEIQKSWFRGADIWNKFHFVVFEREKVKWGLEDLPPNSTVIDYHESGSSTEIRERLQRGESIKDLVSPHVAMYLKNHHLTFS